jgi:hypothetical protein
MAFCLLSDEFYARWVSDNDDGLTDDDLIFALELMKHAEYERIVFYDREEGFGPAEWIEFARDKKRLFFMLFRRDGTPLGAFWFSEPSRTGSQAFAHFCTLNTGEYDEYVRGGRLCIRFIADNTNMQQAIGITPVCYGHALKLAYDLGFEKLTVLKKATPVRRKNRDAILSINNMRELEV